MTIVQRISLLCIVLSMTVSAQRTRPERSNFEETSRYQDVMDFIDALKPDGRTMNVTTFGYSVQGRRLPMIVWGDVADIRPETVRRSGKLVVYIQGNIHAGEVEGKEALLELLRELKNGEHAEWRRRLILLIVPVLNADGNEVISLYNRPWQHGPVAGMGQRANGQGLDLNRDHMKLETPEIRAFVRMLNQYDPHITVDLHTTNGSFHGYHHTYSFALNPMVDAGLDAFTRTHFFPKVTTHMERRKWRIHRYGDYLEKTPAGKPGYFYWAHEPRYNSNYVGFRNRLAVLSESYSYIPFRQRIAATKDFVISLLDVANGNSAAIAQAVRSADSSAMRLTSYDSLAVQAEITESDTAQKILLSAVTQERNPYSGEVMMRMNEDSLRTIVTSEFYAARATANAKVPKAYAVPDSLVKVLELLREHGIVLRTVKEPLSVTAERFIITSSVKGQREFQKHNMRTLQGRFERLPFTIPAGWTVVEMDQPLSRLAFGLLEPEAEDGVVAWNVMDPYFGDGKAYPILKIMN